MQQSFPEVNGVTHRFVKVWNKTSPALLKVIYILWFSSQTEKYTILLQTYRIQHYLKLQYSISNFSHPQHNDLIWNWKVLKRPETAVWHKKTELGAEDRIPLFSSSHRRSEAVIASYKAKISSTSKTCDMSDRPGGVMVMVFQLLGMPW